LENESAIMAKVEKDLKEHEKTLLRIPKVIFMTKKLKGKLNPEAFKGFSEASLFGLNKPKK